ncbi:hypothetical protein [Bradyrhizobium cenepequi]
MSSSSAFRASIAIVVLLAIGWKIAVPADDKSHLKQDLVEFLEARHFNVVVADQSVNDTPIIRATTATCQLQVARLTPDGSNANLIRHLAPGAEHSFVVFRGAVYTRQPVFWTVLDYLWSRFLRELGLVRHISPVISVTESSSCDAERLPWGELQGPPGTS